MSLRERIIAETTDMFVTYGIKSIRMDNIATNLGMSKRTIYEIFGDKENLLLECMRFHFVRISDKKRHLTEGVSNIIDEVLIMLEDWDADMENNHKMFSNLKKFYPKVYETISNEAHEQGFAALREKLKKGVEDGYLLDNINYDLTISVFSNSIYGIMSKQDMILPKNVSERDAFRYVITYFFRGIAKEKGIKMIDDYIEKEKSQHLKSKNDEQNV